MVILFCALAAHGFAATILAFQERWCVHCPCAALGFEPNLYKALLAKHSAEFANSDAIVLAFVGNLVLGLLTGLAAYCAGSSNLIRNLIRPEIVGWALDLSDKAAGDDQVVTAYVLTKLGSEGYFAGYEGMVEKITLADSGAISSLALVSVDRFVVQVDRDGVVRCDREDGLTDDQAEDGDGGASTVLDVTASPMPLMVFAGEEIGNVSFTVIDLSLLPGFDSTRSQECAVEH